MLGAHGSCIWSHNEHLCSSEPVRTCCPVLAGSHLDAGWQRAVNLLGNLRLHTQTGDKELFPTNSGHVQPAEDPKKVKEQDAEDFFFLPKVHCHHELLQAQ